jgi:hypothetical protein
MLLVPQAVVLVVSLLEDIAGGATLSILRFFLVLITVVVTLIVAGAYPSLVQEALAGQPLNVTRSLRQAAGKFWSLLVAAIIVGVLVSLGLLAFIVPGIIFACWWAYTVPSIMLEGRGALDGMSASRAFGRDKKWSTFVILLAIIIVAIIIGVVEAVVSLGSPLAGRVVGSILSVPLQAWASVIFSYIYLTYGPSSTTPAVDSATLGMGPGTIPPTPPPGGAVGQAPQLQPTPGTLTGAPGEKRFCPSCGSPITPDARFCPSCGRPV